MPRSWSRRGTASTTIPTSGLHPHRRRRLFLCRDGPQGRDRETAGDSFKDGSDPSRIDGLLRGPVDEAVDRGRRGPAIAGGTEILQGTDIQVAGESAKFGISEAKWSLYPMGGSAVRLVRQIPYTIACDLLLTGRHITAREALEFGLIGTWCPTDQALDKALEIAEVISTTVRWPCRRSCGRSGRPRPARERRVQDRHQDRHRGLLSEDAKGGAVGVQGEKRARNSRCARYRLSPKCESSAIFS